MTLTIETNKRSFINAMITLCKAAGVSFYFLEDKTNTKTQEKMQRTPEELKNALQRYKDGETEGVLTFDSAAEAKTHFGL